MKRSPPRGRSPGASDPLTPQQEAWVEQGMKVVARCARAHARKRGPQVLYEELLSLGSIGLMQAVRTYRPNSGTDFEVYCYKRIDGAMRWGMKQDRAFYAQVWDASYAYLETTRDEGPSLDEQPGGDEAALHRFSDRFVMAAADKLCGVATQMLAAGSEEAIARREELRRRLIFLLEERARTPEDGKQLLQLLYEEGLDLRAAAERMGLSYGQARGLHERTLDDLGARVRRRCALEPPDGKESGS